MTALRRYPVIVGVILTVLVEGSGIANAQTAPTLRTNSASYDDGATVTFTGAGWEGCDDITVTTIDRGNSRVVVGSSISPVNGSFRGTFVGQHSPDGFGLLAASAQGGCTAQTNFFVGSPPIGDLAVTGADLPLLLVAAGIAVAVGSAFAAAGRRLASRPCSDQLCS